MGRGEGGGELDWSGRAREQAPVSAVAHTARRALSSLLEHCSPRAEDDDNEEGSGMMVVESATGERGRSGHEVGRSEGRAL
jgi:hypothetical protein